MKYIYKDEEATLGDIQEAYEYKYKLEKEINKRQIELRKVDEILENVIIKK